MQKPTAQKIAVQIAKTAADESNEFLKSAREQILPSPEASKPTPESVQNTSSIEDVKPAKNLSFLNEYKSELDQIRRDNLFKELQQRIANGEEVPIENYIKDLSSEQREVLKAQSEAVNARKVAASGQPSQSLPQIIGRKGRQMVNKIKKRNEQHVETRQPPSS